MVGADQKVLVDCRWVGDCYCEKWQRKILETRIFQENGKFFRPDEINYAYSLLYHALIHKKIIARDYEFKLRALLGNMLKENLEDVPHEVLYKILLNFMVVTIIR